MITISQKCQYALRSIFELATRRGQKPTTISDIAAEQAIPPRFLELILNELKQAGLVESRRGAQGGYTLAVSPKELTVGKVIRLIDGPVKPVKCIAGGGAKCPLRGKCAFERMWTKAGDAMSDVFDGTTFQDLIDQHQGASASQSYSI